MPGTPIRSAYITQAGNEKLRHKSKIKQFAKPLCIVKKSPALLRGFDHRTCSDYFFAGAAGAPAAGAAAAAGAPATGAATAVSSCLSSLVSTTDAIGILGEFRIS